MKPAALTLLLAGGLFLTSPGPADAAPPYGGTIFIDPDIITAADPTTYLSTTNAGRGNRWMYDRRANDWVFLNAFLFNATFLDGLQIEIQVNPEFIDQTAARAEALKYAPVIGRLPACLRADVQTVWIHKGLQPFGGCNNNLLIHTGQAIQYEADGILEETFVHEASHTSLDAGFAAAPGWLAAQTADGEFISTYARDNPTREDVAESFLPWLAVRHRPARISAAMANTISQTIPHRMAFFDAQSLDMYPLVPPTALTLSTFTLNPVTGAVNLTWTSNPGRSYVIKSSTNLTQWQTLGANVLSQGATTSAVRTLTPLPPRAFFKVEEVTPP
jgi:hypothetical protein